MHRSIAGALVVALSTAVAALAQVRPVEPAATTGITTDGTTASTGYTSFTPSWDTRIVYVSSTVGHDGNDGLSPQTPKRTITAGIELLRDRHPDWLLLRSGDVWHEPIVSLNQSGRSATERLLISSYDGNIRPTILTGASTGISLIGNTDQDHVAIVGLQLVAHRWTGVGNAPAGIGVVRPGTDLVIEDCRIENYGDSIIIQGNPGVRSSTSIRRNILVNPFKPGPWGGGTNVYTGEIDGVDIIENVMLHSPANEARGRFVSHHIYLGENRPANNRVIGNIAYYGGRTNFNIRSGGLVEDNLSIGGAIGFGLGISYATAPFTGMVSRNVVTENRDAQIGQPLGIGIYVFKAAQTLIEGNIISRSTRGAAPEAIHIDDLVSEVTISSNRAWRWTLPPWYQEARGIAIRGVPAGPVYIFSNDFQGPGGTIVADLFNDGPVPVAPLVQFWGNRYFSSRTGPNWFLRNADLIDAPTWSTAQGEQGLFAGRVSYSDPDRSIATYNMLLGGEPSIDAFIAEVSKQSRFNWRSQYSAQAVNDYFRAGLTDGPLNRCVADCNRDGVVDQADLTLLQRWVREFDWMGDINADGRVDPYDLWRWSILASTNCSGR